MGATVHPMKTNTHTHTGNCQACGRIQAVHNTKGTMAKHGYVVDWNQFHGICQGSDRVPAQVSVEYTHFIINYCLTNARELHAHANALTDGTVDPAKVIHFDPIIEWVNKYGTKRTGKNVEIDYALGSADEQKVARSNAINTARHNADGNLGHAAHLTKFVLPLLGTALQAVEEVAQAKAAAREHKRTGPTKANFKRQLDTLGAKYRALRQQLHDAYLAVDRDARHDDKAATDLYYGAQDLHCWNAKWAKIALAKYPQLAGVVAEMNALVEDRKSIKAAQVAAGV